MIPALEEALQGWWPGH